MEDNYMSDKIENFWEELNEENNSLELKLLEKTSALHEEFKNVGKTAAAILTKAIRSKKFTPRDTDGRCLDIFKLDKSGDFYIEVPGYDYVFSSKDIAIGSLKKDKGSNLLFVPMSSDEANYHLRNKEFWESLTAILSLQVLENDINFKNEQLKDLSESDN